jgi:hypothetical protein
MEFDYHRRNVRSMVDLKQGHRDVRPTWVMDCKGWGEEDWEWVL